MPRTITRLNLVNALHNETGLAATDCADLVESVLNRMSDSLANGEQVKISSFATFSVRHKKERVGRNPKTGEPVHIGSKRTPFFKVGKELRERVNGGEDG